MRHVLPVLALYRKFKELSNLEKGKNTEFYQVLRFKGGVSSKDSLEFIGEEPLLIRIDNEPYSVVMRTPGQEIFHAAGFCLGEGIADSMDDFTNIGYCNDLDPNVIDVRLTPKRKEKIKNILKRRSFISQTSCGICGKQMIEDLTSILIPVENGFKIDLNHVFDCIGKLSKNQKYYPKTRGSHAALIFDDALEIISFAEDVGRHNALDKAIGQVFMEKTLSKASLLVMSSRISYELVQKAARAHIQMIASKSRPTALAVNMGKSLNMTLACAFGETELIVVCGENRIFI